MSTRIQDEFAGLPVSRQRKYQLRMKRDGRCVECGAPSSGAARCLKHRVHARERQRMERGAKRRYSGAPTYAAEALAQRRSEALARLRSEQLMFAAARTFASVGTS